MTAVQFVVLERIDMEMDLIKLEAVFMQPIGPAMPFVFGISPLTKFLVTSKLDNQSRINGESQLLHLLIHYVILMITLKNTKLYSILLFVETGREESLTNNVQEKGIVLIG